MRRLAPLALAGLLLTGCAATTAHATEPAPTPHVTTVAPAVVPATSIPACIEEDGSGQELCLWDARTEGNGRGLSFIEYHGRYYYLEGSGK